MRSVIKIALSLALSVAAGRAVYVAADPEKRDIDQAVRASAPGQFVRLSDGYTHYEVGGPPDGRVVVLAAGISVPYYIWDPTFAALVGAGFRVLRYDYYGRGYSDRPDIAYTQDVYVRQLTELLDALRITQPIDLAGLSFGGSVVTSFADRYPARVRSLVFIDPSFRSPYSVGFLVQRAMLWDALTAVFEERWWADRQLDDFYRPERFPDWPNPVRGTDPVSWLSARPAIDGGQQCDRRSGARAETGRRAPSTGARVLGQGGPGRADRIQRLAAGGDASRSPGDGRIGRPSAPLGAAGHRPSDPD